MTIFPLFATPSNEQARGGEEAKRRKRCSGYTGVIRSARSHILCFVSVHLQRVSVSPCKPTPVSNGSRVHGGRADEVDGEVGAA